MSTKEGTSTRTSRFQKLRKWTSTFLIRPSIRFGLGFLLGACVSVLLTFFPFPKGKMYSYALTPVFIFLSLAIEKYANCSIIFPVTLIHLFQKKAKWTKVFFVYVGLYCGTSYVMSQFHFAIDTAKPEEKKNMYILMEKMFLSLDESIESRLQQSAIVTMLFYGCSQIILRSFFIFIALIWMSTLPELNPILSQGWFDQSKNFSGTQLAQFWVNSLFLVVLCLISLKVLSWMGSGFRYMKKTKTRVDQSDFIPNELTETYSKKKNK